MPISPSPFTDRLVVFSGMLLILTLGLLYILKDNFLPYTPRDAYMPTITVGGTPTRVYVADTEDERSQGLSGTTPLPMTQGMLFVFPEDGLYRIWMKDMLYPIDIIWIRADGTVIDVDTNVPPESFPKTYQPSEPVRYILETTAGYVEQYNIAVGNLVEM